MNVRNVALATNCNKCKFKHIQYKMKIKTKTELKIKLKYIQYINLNSTQVILK